MSQAQTTGITSIGAFLLSARIVKLVYASRSKRAYDCCTVSLRECSVEFFFIYFHASLFLLDGRIFRHTHRRTKYVIKKIEDQIKEK